MISKVHMDVEAQGAMARGSMLPWWTVGITGQGTKG